jgi:heparosan-N-sulfate-glucuronate 5-epimerase
VREESKKIKLELGNVSLEPELGSYYIDMRPALVHYTNNIYNGKFDEQGVPMCGFEDGEFSYFPINIAQYGFMLHANWVETKSEQTLDLLKSNLAVLEKLKTETETTCAWYHHHFEAKYKINAPWASAMAQGECISFYLRMYQITQDASLLSTALKAYHFLGIDANENGVKRIDNEGNLWYEEYPSTPPSYVLNGFIYTLFGLYDLFRVTQRKDVKMNIDRCLKSVRDNLEKFDAGYWSYYDLLKKELVRYYYQKNVHVPQLRVLAVLTGDPIFENYATKWEKQLTPWNYMLVRIMYRVLPRWRKKSIRLG